MIKVDENLVNPTTVGWHNLTISLTDTVSGFTYEQGLSFGLILIFAEEDSIWGPIRIWVKSVSRDGKVELEFNQDL